MNRQRIEILAAIIIGAVIGMSVARAQPADLQPGVQTSADAAAAQRQPALPAQPVAAPARATTATAAATPVPAAAGPSPSSTAPTATAAAARAASDPPRQPAAARPGAAGAGGVDSIELGTTEISGNRELPKLMYIVPWRRDQLGKFIGRPPNSLVDEALTPVDREVFQRQNRYYAALQAGLGSVKSQPGTSDVAGAAAAPRDEK